MSERSDDPITPYDVINAVPGTKGLLQYIADKLGVTRRIVQDMVANDDRVREAVDDEVEKEKDQVMFYLINDAKRGDPKARELYLRAQAKDRGFGVEKTEVSGPNGQPLVVLHATVKDLIGEAPKVKRIDGWANRATDYHTRQIEAANNKTVDQMLNIKEVKKKITAKK